MKHIYFVCGHFRKNSSVNHYRHIDCIVISLLQYWFYFPVDKPGAPSTPVCKGTTEDTITLSWSPPKNNGGSPISGYKLEKREKGDKKWSK